MSLSLSVEASILTINSITGSFLEVIVGQENAETFYIHERLFTSHSEFFKRATKEEWSPAKGVVLLKDDDAATFRLYTGLTYTGFLATKGLLLEWRRLIQVYVMAERLVDVWAKNRIVDAMHSFIVELMPKGSRMMAAGNIDKRICHASLHDLYDGTPTGSPARRLVVDFFADNGTEGWLRSAHGALPADFLLEVTIRLVQRRLLTVFGNMLDQTPSDYYEKTENIKEPATQIEKSAAKPQAHINSPENTANTPEARNTMPFVTISTQI